MKKLLSLLLLISSISIFGAASGDRPEDEMADFVLIIENKTGGYLILNKDLQDRPPHFAHVGRWAPNGKLIYSHEDIRKYPFRKSSKYSAPSNEIELIITPIFDGIPRFGEMYQQHLYLQPNFMGKEIFSIKRNGNELSIEKNSEEDI